MVEPRLERSRHKSLCIVRGDLQRSGVRLHPNFAPLPTTTLLLLVYQVANTVKHDGKH